MTATLVLAPYADGDVVLRRSRWIAALNEKRLVEDGHPVSLLASPALETGPVSFEDIAHVAFFGHGTDSSIRDAADRNILPPQRHGELFGKTVHAFACRCPRDLGPSVVQAGARVFVGYDASLRPLWSEVGIPADALPLVTDVLTAVSHCLAQGGGRSEVLTTLRLAYEALLLWDDAHHGELDKELVLLCGDVYTRMRVLVPTPD